MISYLVRIYNSANHLVCEGEAVTPFQVGEEVTYLDPDNVSLPTTKTVAAIAHDVQNYNNANVALAQRPIITLVKLATTDVPTTGPVVNQGALDPTLDEVATTVLPPGAAWNPIYVATLTDATSHPVAGAIAGKVHHIHGVLVSNDHPTVNTKVDFLDGVTSILRGAAEAGGGGFDPWGIQGVFGSTNAALNVQCGTNGSSTHVTVASYNIPG